MSRKPAESIGLGWSVTATVDVGSTAIATANFGTSGIDFCRSRVGAVVLRES